MLLLLFVRAICKFQIANVVLSDRKFEFSLRRHTLIFPDKLLILWWWKWVRCCVCLHSRHNLGWASNFQLFNIATRYSMMRLWWVLGTDNVDDTWNSFEKLYRNASSHLMMFDRENEDERHELGSADKRRKSAANSQNSIEFILNDSKRREAKSLKLSLFSHPQHRRLHAVSPASSSR